MKAKWLICVVGPTALGKTRWGIALANHYNTEIISADSRQFFREMEIGTAVPSKEELLAAKHHFIQHKSIAEPYSVGDFERDSLELLDSLFEEHGEVLLVGGSGLYVNAVTMGLDKFPKIPAEIRESLQHTLHNEGLAVLQEHLRVADPVYYKEVDLENHQRVIRALEVCSVGDMPYSSYRSKNNSPRNFKTIYLGLEASRDLIYKRIEARVDQMIHSGLVEEARSLWAEQERNALQTVGYRELFRHFEGEWDLDTAIEEIKKNTRRFAKRQLTWFRKNKDIHWIPYDADLGVVTGIIEAHKKEVYGS